MIDEGAIKFDSRWKKTGPSKHKEIDELIRWRAPLFRAQLIGHFEEHDVGYGNLSARIEDGTGFIISGTQTGHVTDVTAKHFSMVTDYDIEANTVTSAGPVEASSESLTHAAIYELDSGINSVVHVHSDWLWTTLKDELPATRESIAYGTPQMAQEFARLYESTPFRELGVARMAGHDGGLISFGRDVREAAARILDLTDGDY